MYWNVFFQPSQPHVEPHETFSCDFGFSAHLANKETQNSADPNGRKWCRVRASKSFGSYGCAAGLKFQTILVRPTLSSKSLFCSIDANCFSSLIAATKIDHYCSKLSMGDLVWLCFVLMRYEKFCIQRKN